MGCTASKLDNEDTVRRCRERRRLMKEAVYARHHLASAHADYCRSLRLTGSALCSFAAGEHLSVSAQTPAVFLHPPTPAPAPAPTPTPTPIPVTTRTSAKSTTIPAPPRVPPSPSIARSKLPHILSSSSINSNSSLPKRQRHRIQKPKPKLPHILSESSTPARSVKSNATSNYGYPTTFQANSTYSTTPSQASSVWNWEDFYPPSPPDSEFFERKAKAAAQHHLEVDDDDDIDHCQETESEREYDFLRPRQPEPEPEPEMDKRSNYSSYSHPSFNNHKNSGKKMEGVETEREEVQCSEWGDHDHDRYTTTSTSSSSDNEQHLDEDGEEIGSRSEPVKQQPPQAQPIPSPYINGGIGGGYTDQSSMEEEAYSRTGEIPSNMGMVVRHRDLMEIVDAIKDNFDKAAAAGDQVSEMLEIGRAQLDRSFRQLKKTVYHSSSILSNLSSSWTSKPPLAVKYRLDAEPGGGPKSLCSTIERLLAWEKKLYEEVKAREGVKIEHEKKLSTLQSQEYKGGDEAKLDKTKASITRLQSLIIVTSQAVSTTSTAINGLRDSDLVPQLVDLCHGLMYMWRSMHQYHEVQNNIVQQVRGLVNQSATGESTSEPHRQATRDLESAVSAWYSSFCRLIKFQRDFIYAVHAWFKLSLLPVSNDNVNGKVEPSDLFNFFDEWKLALDRVPDTVASEAIKSFINVVHAISGKQTEELKIKKRTETVSKELQKKASSLRNIERKFYHSYSMVGLGLPDSGPDNGQVLDARDPLAEKKSELAACQSRVEEELVKHAKAVELTRAMTLNNLQTGLPGVFQALTSFSSLFKEALEMVCTRSYAISNSHSHA